MSKYFRSDFTADNGIYDFYIYEEEETSLSMRSMITAGM